MQSNSTGPSQHAPSSILPQVPKGRRYNICTPFFRSSPWSRVSSISKTTSTSDVRHPHPFHSISFHSMHAKPHSSLSFGFYCVHVQPGVICIALHLLFHLQFYHPRLFKFGIPFCISTRRTKYICYIARKTCTSYHIWTYTWIYICTRSNAWVFPHK